MSMTDEKVKRINELYHKAKAEGLTETEKKGRCVSMCMLLPRR